MTEKNAYSFQVDAEIVKDVYRSQSNYLIEYSRENPTEYCIIYFTGNNLYYPNHEAAFRERVLQKNHFEWYKTRINYGHKHIFVRDVQKQFYLEGINSTLNSSQKLVDFLKQETEGYKVITLGSSAGGFAAITYGQLLNAVCIYSFNGTYEIRTKLDLTSEEINPIIFRSRNDENVLRWMDTRNFITRPETIYYFQSIKSAYDVRQFNHVKDFAINRIQFINSKHGIPFVKDNLPFVWSLSEDELHRFMHKPIRPILFSIRLMGLSRTIISSFRIIEFGIKKIRGLFK